MPGASDYFTAFIAKSWTSGSGVSTLFGALQSAFIVGFTIGSVAVGSLVHRRSPFGLAACGLLAWCVAAAVAGAARWAESYLLLLVARACSGLGEAGFTTVGSPYIQDAAGTAQGTWLGAFYAMIPFGTAVGYGYGTLVAGALNWSWAFFIEAVAMLPLAACFALSLDDGSSAFVLHDINDDNEDDDEEGTDNDEDSTAESLDLRRLRDAMGFSVAQSEEQDVTPKPPTLWAEALLCLRQPCFIWIGLGYAGYSGSIIGFSTFAPSIVVGLGLWSSMSVASIAFSATIATAGVVGTPLGGILLDSWARRRSSRLGAALELSLILVACGGLFVAYAALATEKVSFLGRLFVGTLPLFAATAPMNVAILESVPRANRALGQGLGVLCLHAFGDVPTPILVGYLKDTVAPACNPKGKHDELGDNCPRQRRNLRLVTLVCAAWLLWAVLGFSIAYLKLRIAKLASDRATRFFTLRSQESELHEDQTQFRFGVFASARPDSPPPIDPSPLLSNDIVSTYSRETSARNRDYRGS